MNESTDRSAPRWDIFCRLVDNMGDIGVCWRLARTLALHYGISVRLWLDDFAAFYRLCPDAPAAFAVDRHVTRYDRVEVCEWSDPFPVVEVADCVIEAFACDPPESYLDAMRRRASPPLWVNLEYLTAESWASEYHGLHSRHPRLGLEKVFVFPGFVAGTGGLIREPDLFEERNRFVADADARSAFLAGLCGQPPSPLARLVSLFAYEQAPLGELLDEWASGACPVELLVPDGRVVRDVSRWLDTHARGSDRRRGVGRLTVTRIPFLAQRDYDRLLWCCDLNFVRGEDSFVRAQWADAPFVWHIYRQADDAHLVKLDAFMARYCETMDPPTAEALRAFWLAWNGVGSLAATWAAFQAALPNLAAHHRRWRDRLGARHDLAGTLVKFYEDAVKSQVFQSRMNGSEPGGEHH